MDVKRIVIARTDKIGDLVLSIPSFYMLRKMYPEADITVLVRKYNYEIVKNLPYVNRVLKIDDYRKEELKLKMKYLKPDVFVALYTDEFVGDLAKASKARIKVGPLSKWHSFLTYNKGVFQKRSHSVKNEAQYNLDLVRKLDPKRFDEVFEINTGIYYEEKHRKAAQIFIEENKISGKLLAVNPFMGGSAKNISDEQYIELLKCIFQEIPDINIVLTCHISEDERAQKIADAVGNKKLFVFSNGGDLLNLAAIIDRADVYFGGSTGPTHIAGSLKKKVVGLYPAKKTQSTTRWGVFGNDGNMEYVVPDEGNSIEDYGHKEFDSYVEGHKQRIVRLINKALES